MTLYRLHQNEGLVIILSAKFGFRKYSLNISLVIKTHAVTKHQMLFQQQQAAAWRVCVPAEMIIRVFQKNLDGF